MTELIILRGLPGAGKTTDARTWVAEDREHRARVNRDDIRMMLDKGEYVPGVTEGRVLTARNAMITGLLRQGINVISDDTNLPQRTIRDLMKLAVKAGADWTVTDMTDVPLQDCILRNAGREDKEPVPVDVIRDYHQRFIDGKSHPLPLPALTVVNEITPHVPDVSLPPAIIVDIDGTVALMGDRNPYDETTVREDLPNMPVIEMVWAAAEHYEAKVLFFSGRTDACYGDTEEWVRKHVEADPDMFELHMRKSGDFRQDRIVKYEMFNEHARGKYDVVAVFDDRDSVVLLWRELGLQCFQVADGSFLWSAIPSCTRSCGSWFSTAFS